MSEENLSDLLERSADRHNVGSPPLDQMLSNSRRARRRRAGFMAVAASVVVGSVIAGTTWLFNPSDSPGPAASPTGGVINLEGEWVLTALNDADGKPVVDIEPGCVDCIPPLAERLAERGYSGPELTVEPVALQFDQSVVTIGPEGKCHFSAKYTQTGERGSDLRFSSDSNFLVRSDTNCPTEKAFYSRLADVRQVIESDAVLSLLAEDGSTIATLERVSTEPINLQGKWVLTALADADGKALPAKTGNGENVELSFDDGEVTVEQGCNSFIAKYEQSEVGGRNLRFRDFGGMRGVDCGQPPLYERLPDVRHVSEANGKLQLRAENWMIIAVLERAVGSDPSTPNPTAAALGTVHATLFVTGGPAPGLRRPSTVGRVALGGPLPELMSTQGDVRRNGTIDFQVKPGRYNVGGRMGAVLCIPSIDEVTVRAGEVSTVNIECSIK